MESNKKYNNIFEYIEATYSIFENFITIEDSNLNFKICNDKLVDCDNFFSISEFIDTDRSINDYKFIPSDKINTENISKVTLYEGIAIININNTDIKIDEDSKKIELNFYAPKQRIVIQGEQQNDAILDNWSVTAISTDIFSVPNNDIFGLTGCVNFINVELKNINITTKNLSCEDSVNIIKSSGEIENIFVNDSFSDGLDIDFSQIDIHNVKIINSGNDCLDLSYGIYKFNSVLSENCADKGVSIGEASFVELKNLEINNSKTGLVVKDSSNVLVGNLEVKNSETCFSFYRKKQEFIQPIIEFKNYFCDEEINFIQSGVEFEN